MRPEESEKKGPAAVDGGLSVYNNADPWGSDPGDGWKMLRNNATLCSRALRWMRKEIRVPPAKSPGSLLGLRFCRLAAPVPSSPGTRGDLGVRRAREGGGSEN